MDDGNLEPFSDTLWQKMEKKHGRIISGNRRKNQSFRISGERVYDDICDQIEGKENGTYLVLSKFEEDVVFEYHITVSDDNFNLGILTMKTPEGVFETDFDS